MFATAPVPGGSGGQAVEYLVTGSGTPVTAFVHGLLGSVEQTRPFGSQVAGTRVFPHLRGHGGTPVPIDRGGAPVPGTYDDLAAEVGAVVTATGATRALGVSMGAAVLARILARTPDAFERIVLCLPVGPADGSTGPGASAFPAMADAVDARDVEGLARLLRAHQPERVRSLPVVALWARRRAASVIEGAAAGSGVTSMLRAVPAQTPLPEAAALTAVRAPVLLIAHDDDEVHPIAAAVRYAELLPNAELVVLPAGGVPWCARERLREVVAGFFAATRVVA
jgi:pimeloyl-ACP methyl ester carboxylesterase